MRINLFLLLIILTTSNSFGQVLDRKICEVAKFGLEAFCINNQDHSVCKARSQSQREKILKRLCSNECYVSVYNDWSINLETENGKEVEIYNNKRLSGDTRRFFRNNQCSVVHKVECEIYEDYEYEKATRFGGESEYIRYFVLVDGFNFSVTHHTNYYVHSLFPLYNPPTKKDKIMVKNAKAKLRSEKRRFDKESNKLKAEAEALLRKLKKNNICR